MTSRRVHVGAAVVWSLVSAGYTTKQIAAWGGLHANTIDRYRGLHDPAWGAPVILGARKRSAVPHHIGDIWRDFAPVGGMVVPDAALVAGGLKARSDEDRGFVYEPRVRKLWRSRPISSRVAYSAETPTAVQALATAVESLDGRMVALDQDLRSQVEALSTATAKALESLTRSVEKMAAMAPKIAVDAAAKVNGSGGPANGVRAGKGTGEQKSGVESVQVVVWMLGQLLERVGPRELASYLDVRGDLLRRMVGNPAGSVNTLDEKAREVANLYALTQMEWSDLDEDDQEEVAQMMRRYRKDTLSASAMSHRSEAV
jgi:hypothetical protein